MDDLDGDRDGSTYNPIRDRKPLNKQALKVWRVMIHGNWLTLRDIFLICGEPEASISARLRDFRKERFGSHTVNRRRRGEGRVYEYQLRENTCADPDNIG